jgi:nucleotide-binding universal stress UspA family protein
VVATDGSDNAKRAVEVAAKLAEACGATLTLVHTIPPYVSTDDIKSSPRFSDLPQSARDEIKQLHDALGGLEFGALAPVPAPLSATDFIGNALLEEAEGIAQANGISTIRRVIVYGNAADSIVEASGNANADLIVIGTRGLSDLGGLVFGSVSHKVLQLATCPCLVVK